VQKLISLSLTIGGAVALGISALFASPARADVVTQYLNNGEPAISGFPGPYASVTIDLANSTTAAITFQALDNYTIESADLNVNQTGVQVSGFAGFTVTIPTISNSYNGFTPILCCSASGPTGDLVDDLGQFNLIFHNTSNIMTFMNSATEISFAVTNTRGTWVSAADVLQSNDQGADAAAFIYVCNTDPCTLAGGAANTGYATDGAIITPVPAPLIGGGLPVLLAVGGILLAIRPAHRSHRLLRE
jgi:hypothetical protein